MLKLFEGAMGTQLQNLGIADKPCPEYASVSHFDKVSQIHKNYVSAGADILETNTFGANRLKLANFGLQDQVQSIIKASVKAARSACGKDTKVAGAVGPLGKLIFPLGELEFDEAVDVFKQQIKAMLDEGVDYLLIETILDIQEMRAAVIAAKELGCTVPIISQLTFNEDGRTVTGTDVVTAATILQALGVSIIGMNCSLGPEQLLPIVRDLAKSTNLPISVQPNAGLPTLVDGKTVFPLSPDDMALWVPKLVEAGASIIGGCCGTTPEHIRAMRKALDACNELERKVESSCVSLASRSQVVQLGTGCKTVLIGERINPTGRKLLAQELKEGNLLTVKKDAINQVDLGAKVLDVNVGVPGVDQAQLMKLLMGELSMIVDVPLCIDSTDPKVIEAGLRYFPGRALVNSVSGKQPLQDKILALAKFYGSAVIVLPLADKQLPSLAVDKLAIANDIVQAAKKAGLSDNDIVLDALVLTAATDGKAPGETLKTLVLYKKTFGYPTTMGLSNVSFGLPNRELINSTFFAMALASGLDCPIINPLVESIRNTLSAASVVNGQDSQGVVFSHNYSGQAKEEVKVAVDQDVLCSLQEAVIRGQKELAAKLAADAYLQGHLPMDIANGSLTVAMEKVGEKFSCGKAFLPQVMLSAEAMKSAFDALRANLKADEAINSLGKVVLATVEGDIHDLGKNIVATLLSNSGFTVIDLGKDVPASKVIKAVKEHKPDIVGLCALMTTTLPAMDECIAFLKQDNFSGGIMVGGAVLTQDYADKIGADMYSKDGIKAVDLAKKWLKI